jgi:hypothetical protein
VALMNGWIPTSSRFCKRRPFLSIPVDTAAFLLLPLRCLPAYLVRSRSKTQRPGVHWHEMPVSVVYAGGVGSFYQPGVWRHPLYHRCECGCGAGAACGRICAF